MHAHGFNSGTQTRLCVFRDSLLILLARRSQALSFVADLKFGVCVSPLFCSTLGENKKNAQDNMSNTLSRGSII